MITNFKIFESINRPYKIGDFIIVTIRKNAKLYKKILKITGYTNPNGVLPAIDTENKDKIYMIDNYMINYWSESKEELKTLLDAEKYNL
jgi:hypothetical protein